MASVACKVCNKQYAIVACDTCKTLVCKDCSVVCQGCGTSVCTQHVHLTSKGRKMCGRCKAKRDARKKALREKYAGGGKPGHQAAQSGAPKPTNPVASPPSRTNPTQSAPGGDSAGTSLADLMGGEQLLKPTVSEEEIEAEAGLGARDDFDPEMRLDPEEEERNRKALNEAHFTETGRLELPPMDENRPVLGQSGYQPPSRLKVLLAFVFAGIGTWYFLGSTQFFQDTLFPWHTTDLQFNEGEMAQIQETNRLRNTSNIQQFDIFKQAPIFFLSWLIVGSYFLAITILIIGMIRSYYWSRVANHHLEAARAQDKDNNELLN